MRKSFKTSIKHQFFSLFHSVLHLLRCTFSSIRFQIFKLVTSARTPSTSQIADCIHPDIGERCFFRWLKWMGTMLIFHKVPTFPWAPTWSIMLLKLLDMCIAEGVSWKQQPHTCFLLCLLISIAPLSLPLVGSQVDNHPWRWRETLISSTRFSYCEKEKFQSDTDVNLVQFSEMLYFCMERRGGRLIVNGKCCWCSHATRSKI